MPAFNAMMKTVSNAMDHQRMIVRSASAVSIWTASVLFALEILVLLKKMEYHKSIIRKLKGVSVFVIHKTATSF